MLAIVFFVFAFSDYFKNLRDKIRNDELNLKNKDIGHVLIQHLGEISLIILLFDKLNSSTIIPPNTISFWAIVQVYITALLMIASFYTYGKLIFTLMDNGFNQCKTSVVFFLSIITTFTFIFIG